MKNKLFYIAVAASTCAFALVGCKETEDTQEFDFSISLASEKTNLQVLDNDQIVITTNGVDDEDRVYTYVSSNSARATVSDTGYINTLSAGSVKFVVTEENSMIEREVSVSINEISGFANGGFNYSAAAGEQAIRDRTEILGKLEKYAIESHLTGITLFENGGYVKYRDRLEIPAKEYITGYGFGILSEGDITADLATETTPEYKRYYHSAQTNNPNKINQWNASGSQVSDLAGYITSSYWGNKMNENKDGYEWYPVLAADKIDGKVNDRPIPVYETENPLGLYKTWKIYVKTGANSGLKYRYSGNITPTKFEKRNVELKDYSFVLQLLLTGANKQLRGSEMAGDKTYGIKGAQSYFNRTKDALKSQEELDNIWNEMTLTGTDGKQDPSKFSEQQLGIMVGTDEKGDYLQLELINEIDKFTAMYTLSSSLYSPVPREFIEALSSKGTVKDGILNYGQNSTAQSTSIVDNTISLGAYKLDHWEDSYIAFGQDDTWVERTTYPNRYKIKGIKITTYDNATQEQLYLNYNKGLLDSCGIPTSHISEEQGQPDVRTTKGDSTFKLNVNSSTQAQWDYLNEKVWGNSGRTWEVKPWMSNDNFLNGLYWSIDRKTFATNRGMQPSINYFADAYLSDPENGVSYNDSGAHKSAVSKWHDVRTVDGVKIDNYGFDYDKAVNCFKSAVNELVAKGDIKRGTAQNPTEIKIHIRWMYQTDITDYGDEIGACFERAFNDPAVSQGKVKLKVVQEAVTNWEDVYNVWMMKGNFDLAFGAISGNTYNPLNFLEVLRSDNSSTFTLNWGPDTSKVDEKNPLVYDGKKWSFDALWEVADRGGVVENGVSVKTVKNYYFDGLAKDLDGATTDDYSQGATFDVKLEFVDVPDVEFTVDKVQVYVVGSANYDITEYTYDKAAKTLHCKINASKAASLTDEMIELNNKGKNPGDQGYMADPFTRGNYEGTWTLEIYYSLSIKGGTPSQSMVTVAKSQQAQAN